MKEHPILFSGPMILAVLGGRKTQTRRIVKLPDGASPNAEFHHIDKFGAAVFTDGTCVRCPYGQQGDRLWVRETTEADYELCDSAVLARYSADRKPVLYSGSADPEDEGTSIALWDYPREVRPSIHMPRWASRIDLEITGVRVERLQDINEKDARAEGVAASRVGPCQDGLFYSLHRDSFIELWESINGPGSWDNNPFVWCITFKRL